MEQPLALLMADLSGYTALTETHGAASAADLIDRYIEIVSRCLQGKSRLQERTGDALMVIAPSADHLVQTAGEILKQTSAEKNFFAGARRVAFWYRIETWQQLLRFSHQCYGPDCGACAARKLLVFGSPGCCACRSGSLCTAAAGQACI